MTFVHAQQAHNSATSSVPDTTIDTGDAKVMINTETVANTNTLDTKNGSSTSDSTSTTSAEVSTRDTTTQTPEVITSSSTASSTENATSTADLFSFEQTNASNTLPAATSSEVPASKTYPVIHDTDGHNIEGSNTAASSSNSATVTNNASSTAGTGDNTASGQNVAIQTGDATAVANVLNVVNTNITDSTGLINFINNVLGYSNFDLRMTFQNIYGDATTANSTATTSCTLNACDQSGIYTNVQNRNNATITNNILVEASTGGNTASGTNAAINTGNAYASANVINVANTNIDDSRYLLLVFNNFDSYAGDIVLPSSSFYNSLFSGIGTQNNVTANNTNETKVQNNVQTVADTGANSAGGQSNSVQTGTANAESIIQNKVNTDILGGNAFSMLIKVHGTWSGTITGLPDGISWVRTPEGIRLYSTQLGNSITGALQNYTTSNTNFATINNNVKVFALTGANNASSSNNASIHTGNAYAGSNILNLTNTNIIGSNWMNLIFNIYGNWGGDLMFGQPDLWLGVQAHANKTPSVAGSKVTYTFTVFNAGDTTAHDVSLNSRMRNNTIHFASGVSQKNSDGAIHSIWQLGDIAPNQTVEISHSATLDQSLPTSPETTIPLSATVVSTEHDANTNDNTDSVIITAGKPDHVSSLRRTFPAHFTISKTADKNSITPGETVTYNVQFHNSGGQLFNSLLVDVLRDKYGNTVREQSWPFDTIENDGEINVSYDIAFDPNIATGTYTNTAQLFGYQGARNRNRQTMYESPIAMHTLTVVHEEPQGEVLGIATSTCPAYIQTYMHIGGINNSSDVTRLQQFLNANMGTQLALTGIFNTATENDVRAFQNKYSSSILDPWGLHNATGNVYFTTRKAINKLYCQNERQFPLTLAQRNEIHSFRLNTQLAVVSPRTFVPQTEPQNTQTVPKTKQHQVERAPTLTQIPEPTTQKPQKTGFLGSLFAHMFNKFFTTVVQAQ